MLETNGANNRDLLVKARIIKTFSASFLSLHFQSSTHKCLKEPGADLKSCRAEAAQRSPLSRDGGESTLVRLDCQ